MGRLNATDATAAAMRGLAWPGAQKTHATSRKYAVTGTAAQIDIPKDANDNRPSLMRFSIPSGSVVYVDFSGAPAVVPTTSVDGAARVLDGDTAAVIAAQSISVIAEANATITISYLWT